MEESRTGFVAWVKAHRKQLILAGISITALIGIVLGLKNKDAIKDLWATLEDNLKRLPSNPHSHIPIVESPLSTTELAPISRNYTPPQNPFDVSQHIRTMTDGRHHSPEKAAEALALGIVLLPNQTLVDSYTKGMAA